MKIGILTYHRSHNYGAMLQAIALRKVLQDMGHDVTFMDYWPQHQKNIYRLFVWEMFWRGGIRGRLRYLKMFAETLVPKLIRRKNFDRFYRELIKPYVNSCKKEYDIIVYGSDQIWRKQDWGYGYNPVYFGKNDFKAQKHISYAASMGILPESEIEKAVIKQYLCNLDHISVREAELKTFVESLELSCDQHLDPTLLLTGKEWTNLMHIQPAKKQRYVLYYHLMGKSFDIDQIRLFARNKGLTLKIIYSRAIKKSSEFEITTAGPMQFLELVYGAEFVFTSSFHGLVFSLLFQKQVFASFSVNAGRAVSLLSQLGIEDRLLPPMTQVPIDISDIDYNQVSSRMNKLRESSYNYLRMI